MSVDIGALLAGYAAEQERAAQAQAPDLLAEVVLLAARVRARRLHRVLAVIGVSVVTVLLGSAVAFGLSHDALSTSRSTPGSTSSTTSSTASGAASRSTPGTASLGCSEPWPPPAS